MFAELASVVGDGSFDYVGPCQQCAESALSEKGVSGQMDPLVDLAAVSSMNFETVTVAGVGPVEHTAGVAETRIGGTETVAVGLVALTASAVAAAVENTVVDAAAKAAGRTVVVSVGFAALTASAVAVARTADRVASVCVAAAA